MKKLFVVILFLLFGIVYTGSTYAGNINPVRIWVEEKEDQCIEFNRCSNDSKRICRDVFDCDMQPCDLSWRCEISNEICDKNDDCYPDERVYLQYKGIQYQFQINTYGPNAGILMTAIPVRTKQYFSMDDQYFSISLDDNKLSVIDWSKYPQ
jgi:hypothetical protein